MWDENDAGRIAAPSTFRKEKKGEILILLLKKDRIISK
jgi:hypothetical protein